MDPHAIIDLHCDTLTAFTSSYGQEELLERLKDPERQEEAVRSLLERVRGKDTLDLPQQQFSLSKVTPQMRWAQCCAIFVPDGLKDRGAIAYYDFHQKNFARQMSSLSEKVVQCRTAEDIERAWSTGRAAAILTIENGSPLAGRLERVEQLARDGVRMITLTWNGENEIGSGNTTDHGLSPFGRAVVPEMEAQGILVDVSHLNDPGFYDLLEVAQRPFVASHSNARSVCSHKRNLTDDQIRVMVERQCLIGLNYSNYFLRDDGQPATLEDLYRHIAHFLELGAEDCLALGSDFDGTDVPPCLDSMDKVAGLYSCLTGLGLSSALTEKIMWRNAMEFFRKNLG